MIVKICGITRESDAEAAVAAGVDWIGLNFWPRSRRHVDLEQAGRIAAVVPGDVKLVGVFVNQPATFVEEAARRIGLALVQLHGDEDLAYCERFAGRYLRAVRVGAPADLAGLERYAGAVACLLDTPSEAYGGSGRTWNWGLLGATGGPRQFLLAGGLTPDNVAEAVRTVRPYGVDVAGGVETAPGIKDPDAMGRFVHAAKQGHKS
jgi:phosphoribosylanthranilate isomerase